MSTVLLICLVFPAIAHQNLKAQTPSVSIASIEFEGNKSLNTQQLRQQLHLSAPGEPYSAQGLEWDLRRLEKTYQDDGFLRVRIGPPNVQIQKTGNGETAEIRIPIDEGPRYVAGKVSIKNTGALAADTLAQMYPLRKGQSFRRRLISEWQEKVREAYGALGYIRARCDAHEMLNDIEKTVDCTLECNEGKSYSVGKITVTGDESIDQAKFKRRLLLSEGGTFNPENLVLSIEFLNQSGLYGRISNTDVGMTIDDARGIVDLTFRVSSSKK